VLIAIIEREIVVAGQTMAAIEGAIRRMRERQLGIVDTLAAHARYFRLNRGIADPDGHSPELSFGH